MYIFPHLNGHWLKHSVSLQTHFCPKETRHLNVPELLGALNAIMECQNPTTDLYRFVGTMKLFNNPNDPSQITAKISLGFENVLLRGARLKDTEFIYGNHTFRSWRILNAQVATKVIFPWCIPLH